MLQSSSIDVSQSRLAALHIQYPSWYDITNHTCCLQGATDVPSWQERIKGTAGRLMDGCKHSSMLSCSSSPSVVEEAVHNGPLCTEKDSTAQQCKASTPRHAVSSLTHVLSTCEAQYLQSLHLLIKLQEWH